MAKKTAPVGFSEDIAAQVHGLIAELFAGKSALKRLFESGEPSLQELDSFII